MIIDRVTFLGATYVILHRRCKFICPVKLTPICIITLQRKSLVWICNIRRPIFMECNIRKTQSYSYTELLHGMICNSLTFPLMSCVWISHLTQSALVSRMTIPRRARTEARTACGDPCGGTMGEPHTTVTRRGAGSTARSARKSSSGRLLPRQVVL